MSYRLFCDKLRIRGNMLSAFVRNNDTIFQVYGSICNASQILIVGNDDESLSKLIS